MIFFEKFLIFLTILPLSLPQEIDLFHSPLIVEINESQLKEWSFEEEEEEVELQCRSWRVAVEANNLRPWRKIPEECGDYVKFYIRERGYESDGQRVCEEAGVYARSVNLSGDGKYGWVLDLDETLPSNLPYYDHHGYGRYEHI